MVNVGLVSAVIFYGIVLLYFFKTRKKWDVHGILALYRTKIGIKFMDKLARKFPRTLKFLGYVGIVVGFIGMAFTFVMLVKSALDLLLIEGAPPGFAPVLPGVKIPGLPTLSFWHWLIGIFVLATVHEFAHGVLARVHKLEVKNSGFGFLGPILLAFVEPDEEKLAKASAKTQLSVYSAGPFSNFLFAGLFLLVSLFVMGPIVGDVFISNGIEVSKFTEGFPAERSGLEVPFVILGVDGKETLDRDSFLEVTDGIKPDEVLKLKTDQGDFEIRTVENPNDPEKGYIGIEGIGAKVGIREGVSEFKSDVVGWFNLLFFWLFILNFGVGLFNLLPLGPVDGGRMFLVASLAIFKNEKKAKKVWMITMYIVLFLIIVNLLPWLGKLLSFISGFFVR